jgi:large subunit ribosomal protein L23
MTHSSNIINRPRITEKSTLVGEVHNAYVFEVAGSATKKSIAKAIKDLYKVTPFKVNIVNLPQRKVVSKGKVGKRAGVKKAYVYLKKGETIDLI